MDEAKVDDSGVALEDGTRTTQNTYDLAVFGKDGQGVIDKDPTVTVRKGSDDCYIFIAIDNELPNKFDLDIDTENWIKVAENGTSTMYAYHELLESITDKDRVLEPLFKHVTCSSELSETKMSELDNSTIKLTAYALQKEGFSEKDAVENAAEAFAALDNSPYSLSKSSLTSESFLDEAPEEEGSGDE